MNNSESGYFDFKNSIERMSKEQNDRIDTVEIYLKQVLKSNQNLEKRLNDINEKFNKYISEVKKFNDWYNSQSIFKIIKWKLLKRDNEYLIKQFKKDERL